MSNMDAHIDRLVFRRRIVIFLAMLPVAINQLHDERCRAIRPFQLIECGDVRVIQRGENLGLALEAA